MSRRFSLFIALGLIIHILFSVDVNAEEQKSLLWEVGDIVTLGRYEQDGNEENGPEAIEWIVLDKKDDGCYLLLSQRCLDAKSFHSSSVDITWENCSLRKWLNEEFIQAAFLQEEQNRILLTDVDNSAKQGYERWKETKGGSDTKDRVFLLSYAEANRYLGVTFSSPYNPKAAAELTTYAIENGAYRDSPSKAKEDTFGWWWLRSPGYTQYAAAGVEGHGSLVDSSVSYEAGSIRPALWLNLNTP